MNRITPLDLRDATPIHAEFVACQPRGPVDYPSLRIRIYLLLVALDGVATAAAFTGADLLRFGGFHGFGATSFLVLFPIYLAVGLNGGAAWSIAALASPRTSAVAATRALLIAVAVTTLVFFTLKIGEDFSRLVFGVGSAASLLLMAMSRLIVGNVIGRRCSWTFRREVRLVDGVRDDAEPTEFVIDATSAGLRPILTDPLMHDRLARALDGCERVVVACPPERRTAWSRMLAGSNADVEIVAPELEAIGALGLRCDGKQTSLLVGVGPLSIRDRAIKRLFDIAASSALLLLLSPVLAAAAIAVRMDTPGPVIFTQERIGRGNRLFRVLKFRSMRVDAEDRRGSRSTSRNDDRITRVGQFLRKTSLDELPQLINVLKGDMSIVGPRPHPIGCRAEDQLFWAIEDRYFDRHAIKPGITGLAQVRGFRGATWKRSDVTGRVEADLEYLAGWHLGRDIAILLRTLGVVVHPNAF
jgi:exopolysaccharide biosynthesis polyprenyl glycosylphosphotransferase